MAIKKMPVRECMGCMQGKPKKELVRVVRAPDGTVSLDSTGKKPGRGAYLCPEVSCLNLARKARRLERALKCAIPDEVYDAMAREMEKRRPNAE